jgi:hypothetical protein
MPVAQHAAVRSPTFRPARIVDFDPAVDLFKDGPGLLLIDPWFLRLPNGQLRLTEALARLPTWAPPVVLANQNDPQFYDATQLIDDATSLCNQGRRPASERRDVRSVEMFDAVIPFWVQIAFRRFRERPIPRTNRTYARRQRLGDSPIDEEEDGR